MPVLPVLYLFLWSYAPVHILIDPGHGGTNLGAIAVDGTPEKHLTLDLALRLEKALLAYPVKTAMTRRTDEYLSLTRRTEMVRNLKPNCFVSLHFNASPLKNRTGIEIFFPETDRTRTPGTSLAVPEDAGIFASRYVSLLEQRSLATGSRNLARRLAWRLDAAGWRIAQVAPAVFDVITENNTRSILFEGGFLDHKSEGSRVLQENYRERLALALAASLAQFCSEPLESQLTW